MKYSILIPVYNTSKYLRQCLDSVLAQDFGDYEVILVNDGSTDNSEEICNEYVKKDSRIKFYSKRNEGLLLTRRYSLPLSSGEYILFLDSDDYWDSNLLSTIDKILVENANIDIVLYRFRRVQDCGKFISEDNGIFQDGTIFTKETKNEFILKFVESSRLNTIWSKCVKRNIIDIDSDYTRFKDKKGEDLLQSIVLINNSNTIYYSNRVLMSYRMSTNGRGRNFKLKYFNDFEVVREHVYGYLCSMKVNDNVWRSFYIYYNSCILNMLKVYIGKCKSYECFCDVCTALGQYKLYQKSIVKNKNLDKILSDSVYRICLYHYIRMKSIVVESLKKMLRWGR